MEKKELLASLKEMGVEVMGDKVSIEKDYDPGVVFTEFARNVEETVKKIFPNSFVRVTTKGYLGSDDVTLWFTFLSKEEWPYGIRENDPLYSIIVFEGPFEEKVKMRILQGGKFRVNGSPVADFHWVGMTGSSASILKRLERFFLSAATYVNSSAGQAALKEITTKNKATSEKHPSEDAVKSKIDKLAKKGLKLYSAYWTGSDNNVYLSYFVTSNPGKWESYRPFCSGVYGVMFSWAGDVSEFEPSVTFIGDEDNAQFLGEPEKVEVDEISDILGGKSREEIEKRLQDILDGKASGAGFRYDKIVWV